MPEVVLLAPCGINCAACDIYRAAEDPSAAAKLAADWRVGGRPNAQPDWFRCRGCRTGGVCLWSPDCRIRSCVSERGALSCADCDEFPCPPLETWADGYDTHRLALARLRAMYEACRSDAAPT